MMDAMSREKPLRSAIRGRFDGAVPTMGMRRARVEA